MAASRTHLSVFTLLLVVSLLATPIVDGGAPFSRGDTNIDGSVNLLDPIYTLDHLFNLGPAPCLDAMDFDDDGSVNIADPIGLLGYLFLAATPPAPPFPGCGPDPVLDALDCLTTSTNCAVNTAPAIVSVPVVLATVNTPYAYDVEATDPEFNTLTYSLEQAPVGMTIDAGTGTIAWIPMLLDLGTNAVTVRATDDGSPALFAEQSFSITVDTFAGPGFTPIQGRGDQLPAQPSGVHPLPTDDKPTVLAPSYFSAGVPIGFANGELTLQRTDLRVQSRGFDFEVTRSYSSIADFPGVIGHNWAWPFDRRVLDLGGSCWIADGYGREDEYQDMGGGLFVADDIFSELQKNPNGTYTETLTDGSGYEFDSSGSVVQRFDRHGNQQSYDRNSYGNIVRAFDTQDRMYLFAYTNGTAANDYNDGTADQKVQSITDFSGRMVVYTFDADGNLTAARSPVVTGTPTGNDFPNGKTTLYAYTTGNPDPRENHNLLSEFQPAYNVANSPTQSTPWFTAIYDGTSDRIDSVRWGNDNGGPPAQPGLLVGGTFTFDYSTALAGDPNAPAGALQRTRVLDPNGNQVDHYFDSTRHEIFTLVATNRNVRPGEGDYGTTYAYDALGRLLHTTLPRGNQHQYLYDDMNPSQRGRGNVLEVRSVAGTLTPTGDPLITRYTYGPLFNRVHTTTDGRGFPGGAVPTLPSGQLDLSDPIVSRYTKTFFFDYQETTGTQAAAGVPVVRQLQEGLGDLNGAVDFNEGNVVQLAYPNVQTPGPNLGQSITETFTFNDAGQLLTETNGAAQSIAHSYFTSNGTPHDPSDKEGYLQSTTLDPGGLNLTTLFDCDERGNRTSITDPKGQTETHQFNQLDQKVLTISRPWTSAGTGHGVRFFFDGNDNLVGEEIDNLDFNGIPYLNPVIETNRDYSILNVPVSETRDKTRNDGTQPGTVTIDLHYDPNLNQLRLQKPLGNSISWTYDERDLPYQQMIGDDPTTAEIQTTNYNANGLVAEMIDFILDSTAPAAPMTLFPGSGSGDVTQYLYDEHDRRTQTTDGDGTMYMRGYDNASNVISSSAVGVPDESTPTPTLLSGRTLTFDELNRNVRIDETHNDIGTGLPIGDGFGTTQFGHNGAFQITMLTDDNNNTTARTYDGAGRCSSETDALSNSVGIDYDANSNKIQLTHNDVSSGMGNPPETFVETFEYDGLDRETSHTDPGSSRTEKWYDSLDNVTQTSDALRGSANTGLGNLVTWNYDALQRLVARTRFLTTDGWGNTPVATTLTTGFDWDDNSNLSSRTDPNMNITSYAYNDRDRRNATFISGGAAYSSAWDRDGREALCTDANGTSINSSYNAKNQRLSRTAVLGTGVTGPTAETFGRDGLGRCTSGAFGTTCLKRRYDTHGNCVSEDQSGWTTLRTYDGWRNQTSITHPSGHTTTRTYDPLNRCSSAAFGAYTTLDFHYRGPRRVEQCMYHYGGALRSTSTYFYNNRRWRSGVTHRTGVGTIFHQQQCGFNRRGNVQFHNFVTAGNTGNVFEYDSASRLFRTYANANLTTAPLGQQIVPGGFTSTDSVTNSYDPAGNRNQRTFVDTTSTTTLNYTSNNRNEYTQLARGVMFTFASDDNGNVTSDGVFQYSYDFRNCVTAVSSGGTPVATYGHDCYGRRVYRDTVGAPHPVWSVFSGGTVIEEANATTGDIQADNFWTLPGVVGRGRELLLRHKPQTFSLEMVYNQVDGSPSLVTDATNVPIVAYAYDDTGGRLASAPNVLPYGAQGFSLDEATRNLDCTVGPNDDLFDGPLTARDPLNNSVEERFRALDNRWRWASPGTRHSSYAAAVNGTHWLYNRGRTNACGRTYSYWHIATTQPSCGSSSSPPILRTGLLSSSRRFFLPGRGAHTGTRATTSYGSDWYYYAQLTNQGGTYGSGRIRGRWPDVNAQAPTVQGCTYNPWTGRSMNRSDDLDGLSYRTGTIPALGGTVWDGGCGAYRASSTSCGLPGSLDPSTSSLRRTQWNNPCGTSGISSFRAPTLRSSASAWAVTGPSEEAVITNPYDNSAWKNAPLLLVPPQVLR
ncbi:MAG: DUF6531 domain-containing protein [Planctomycetota bacterium]